MSSPQIGSTSSNTDTPLSSSSVVVAVKEEERYDEEEEEFPTSLRCDTANSSPRSSVLNEKDILPESEERYKASRSLSDHFPIPVDYDYTKSTELNYSVDISQYAQPYFKGRYAKYRETLDYAYHKYYSPTRLEFHDRLIDIFLEHADANEASTCAIDSLSLSSEGAESVAAGFEEDEGGGSGGGRGSPTSSSKKNPRSPNKETRDRNKSMSKYVKEDDGSGFWLVFTSGPMGVGKGHVMRWLLKKKLFPLQHFRIIDPDFFRDLLPENQHLIELNPDTSGYLTQKEAGYLAEVVSLAALDEGKSILVDGSLRDAGWYSMYINAKHKVYPKLKIAIFNITANEETIFKRVAAREKITGRRVPRSTVEASITQIPEALITLAPLCNYVAMFENQNNKEPMLVYHSSHVASNEEIDKRQAKDDNMLPSEEVCDISFNQHWMADFKHVWKGCK